MVWNDYDADGRSIVGLPAMSISSSYIISRCSQRTHHSRSPYPRLNRSFTFRSFKRTAVKNQAGYCLAAVGLAQLPRKSPSNGTHDPSGFSNRPNDASPMGTGLQSKSSASPPLGPYPMPLMPLRTFSKIIDPQSSTVPCSSH